MRVRQILTSASTLLAVAIGYVVYVSTLGQLTDFPQLSAELRTPMPLDGSQELQKPTIRESEVAAVRGFGPSCPQVAAPLILESRPTDHPQPGGRGLGTFVYADTYEISKEDPRQLLLKPFSLAHIVASKDGNADRDEIMTVHAEQAVLEFDRPIDITKLSDLNPLTGWVKGDVTLKTNRRTVEPNDDIVMFTERLDYDSSKHLIWANETVKIVVENEVTISGKGLEIELYSEDAPDPSPDRKRAAARAARLLSDVRFELTMDADEDFLGSGKEVDPAASLERKTQQKSEVVVSARGPFLYDLERDLATFQDMVRVLSRAQGAEPGSADSIDQLEADTLGLQFGKLAQGESEKPGGEMKIIKAVATGTQVILLSESRKLQASGNYLEFDAAQKRVALRGEQEMIAVQNNAVIHARGLIIEQDESNDPRRIIAEGPSGWMELTEEEDAEGTKEEKETPSGEASRQLRVKWQKQLIMDRRPESESFAFQIDGGVELEHAKGALTCERLRGLLVPVKEPAAGEKKSRSRLEPIKLEAEGHVSFHSDQVDVTSETLLMDILNRRETTAAAKEAEKEADGEVAEPVARKEIENPAAVLPPLVDDPQKPPLPNGLPLQAPDVQKQKEKDPGDALAGARAKEAEKEADDPLAISARTVAIVLERVGDKSQPVSAWAEGNVRVSQAPKNPGDRPIEILGNQLEFKKESAGDLIVVGGTDKNFAEIRSVDMELSTQRKILLNETTNKVEIIGPGVLKLTTSNSLSGEASDQPVPVQVEWRESMTFDGKNAFFEGDVEATTATPTSQSEIKSKTMEVTFDRKIDFRKSRAGSGGEPERKPQIESVFCERDVAAYTRDMKAGATAAQMRILSSQMRYDNIERTVTVDGAGNLTIVEPSKPKRERDGRVVPPELPFVVTMISFEDRMTGDQSNSTVKFFGRVDIVHTPVEDPSAEVDRENLPEDGMTIKALRAELSQGQDPQGKKYRLFNANEDVKVQAKQYHATCGRVSYDEQKDMVVFEGEKDRPAYFHHQARPGQPFQTMTARSIRFNRATQEIITDRSDGLQSLDVGGSPRATPKRR